MGEPSNDPSGSQDRGQNEVFCRHCGAVISELAEICPECGVRQFDPPQSSVDSMLDDVFTGGNPFVAAVLSAIFPGLGQIYNRELEKGLVIIVAGFISAILVVVLVGLLLLPLVWLYAVYDAYTVADRQRSVIQTMSHTASPTGEWDSRAADNDRSRGTSDSPTRSDEKTEVGGDEYRDTNSPD